MEYEIPLVPTIIIGIVLGPMYAMGITFHGLQASNTSCTEHLSYDMYVDREQDSPHFFTNKDVRK